MFVTQIILKINNYPVRAASVIQAPSLVTKTIRYESF